MIPHEHVGNGAPVEDFDGRGEWVIKVLGRWGRRGVPGTCTS